jgi:murein DD-endopeptidase
MTLPPTAILRATSTLLLLSLLLSGCAPLPRHPADSAAMRVSAPATWGQAVAQQATRQVGAPYRYGGVTPQGFDCSGLVYFAYRQAGIAVPRSVAEQYRYAKPLRLADAQPGDVLFFRLGSRGASHVGIVTEGEHFVHAPRGGKSVMLASLDNPYWRDRLLRVGRF